LARPCCRYAEFYKELGEPELGFLLVCSADFLMAEGFDPDITLTRRQTIMLPPVPKIAVTCALQSELD
jgi:hypothetical protein